MCVCFAYIFIVHKSVGKAFGLKWLVKLFELDVDLFIIRYCNASQIDYRWILAFCLAVKVVFPRISLKSNNRTCQSKVQQI